MEPSPRDAAAAATVTNRGNKKCSSRNVPCEHRLRVGGGPFLSHPVRVGVPASSGTTLIHKDTGLRLLLLLFV